MRKNILIAPVAALLAISPLSAQEPPKQEFPSPNAIVDAAPASDWQAIATSDLLVMDLAPDAKGEARRVIIQLMPPPFSQGWIGNIRKLAAAKFWDGTSINRVQDNYVVQWGDAGYDNPESGETEQKALPNGLEVVGQPDEADIESVYKFAGKVEQLNPYEIRWSAIFPKLADDNMTADQLVKFADSLWWGKKLGLNKYLTGADNDAYLAYTRFNAGWPIALGNNGGAWPIHCYGAVGVGRNLSPDTGTGAELYTVIGHAPRHLDRNIAVVGRIVEGIGHLSSLPRGKGQLGFYADPKKRVPIQSIRLGNALPDAEQPRFEYLDTESKTFAQYADARANRRDPFFIKPAGGADICNIPVPVRRVTP